MLEQNTTYFFVDEAGDAVFYDKRGSFIVGKEGCSKILLLGFIRTENPIYFANRGNRERQEPLENAVRTAALTFENKWGRKVDSDIQIFPQTPVGEPCLQIADYMNWAAQRAFIKGEERYFKFVEEKISYLVDIYDFDKYPNNFYNKKNRFEVNKISPL